MLTVVFVVGKPRVGKDTFAEEAAKAVPSGWTHRSVSSIDPIRAVASALGISDPSKSELYRQFLAEVGDVAERLLKLRTAHVMAEIARGLDGRFGSMVAFVQVREQHVIDNISAVVGQMFPLSRVAVVRITSDRRGETITSNTSDRAVGDVREDFVVRNDGTREELAEQAALVMKQITQGGTK